jgi:hypothetical protein
MVFHCIRHTIPPTPQLTSFQNQEQKNQQPTCRKTLLFKAAPATKQVADVEQVYKKHNNKKARSIAGFQFIKTTSIPIF